MLARRLPRPLARPQPPRAAAPSLRRGFAPHRLAPRPPHPPRATPDDDDDDARPSRTPTNLLARWSVLTGREKAVVSALAAGALVFGPRLLVLGFVAAERALLGVALGTERALGAAFLTSFTWLTAAAGFLLAGGLIYIFVLEDERLEKDE